MNVHKFLYLMVHIVTPLTYFIVSIVWGYFALSKSTWENMLSNLSIMGIYYLLVSVFWITNMKTIDKVMEKLKNEKNDLISSL
ncbi:hypothetical protein [Paenibacillus larvae]|uniref:hypothetical protein n=1 Tax=Paenibacillus larvae TaxID=1464 RepID=UPI00288FABE4|nr:hypothetical protein [Paenibacillus larvae]MDT2191612.1 hypothetical protein [Paenibacillus larvae]MDT2238047.1 hypothetical protein [Paenibacillus larvae]MDT2248318.1 hypothetical protein [Paenibacillus larvae]MDT2260135.1 hypothetical protein [Paenibacillus larvae]MDT2275660.1 hypothetical protein [Paenibacillus larvae]